MPGIYWLGFSVSFKQVGSSLIISIVVWVNGVSGPKPQNRKTKIYPYYPNSSKNIFSVKTPLIIPKST